MSPTPQAVRLADSAAVEALQTYVEGLVVGSGNRFLVGEGAPASNLGTNGDGYFDKAAKNFYGPKASGAWPAPVSLQGTSGDPATVADGAIPQSKITNLIDVLATKAATTDPRIVNSVRVVNYGTTAGTARPDGAVLVVWIGSEVDPSNATTTDLIIRTDELDEGTPVEVATAAALASEISRATAAEGLKANKAGETFTGAVIAPIVGVSGGGALLGRRDRGRTSTAGPPLTGVFVAGDESIDVNEMRWRCITGGTDAAAVWNPAGYGNVNQVATEFNPSTWVTGGPVTVSTTPTTVNVDSTTGWPTTGTFLAGTGVPEDVIPTRVEVTYTGITATSLTGCTISSGTYEIPDLTHVWYSKSGLRAACLRVSNQIMATAGIDNRPHDLVLVAAFDPSTAEGPDGQHGRGDYDVIVTREAGSYGVFIIDLPVKIARDCLWTDGAGGELMRIAGGTTSPYNNEVSPMPTGTIDFMATLRGAQGADDHLVLRRAADADARIKFLNNAGVEIMYMIEAATCIPNATDLRFMTSSGSGYASMQLTTGATFSLRHAGSGGSRVLASNGSTVLETISDTGVHVFGGAEVQKLVTGTQATNTSLTLNAASGNAVSILLNANVTSSSISNAATGQRYSITFQQDGTGGRTYAWPTNIVWQGPVPSSTLPSSRISVDFIYDGTNWVEVSRSKPHTSVRVVTAAATITDDDQKIVFNTASNISQALPAVAEYTAGKELVLNNKSTGVVTITSTLQGVASRTLPGGTSWTVFHDGADWLIA